MLDQGCSMSNPHVATSHLTVLPRHPLIVRGESHTDVLQKLGRDSILLRKMKYCWVQKSSQSLVMHNSWALWGLQALWQLIAFLREHSWTSSLQPLLPFAANLTLNNHILRHHEHIFLNKDIFNFQWRETFCCFIWYDRRPVHLLAYKWQKQNQRVVEVGMDLWRSSGPTLLLKQGHLEMLAQAPVQTDS